MKTTEIFEELRSCKDFDEISGEDCVKTLPAVIKNVGKCNVCCIWHPLVELDRLMVDAKEAELRVNGIEKVLNIPEVQSIRVFREGVDMEEAETELKTTASSIIYQYKAWKLSRDRFLKGQMGSFYDFGELASLIANLVILSGSKTYTQFYLFLKSLIFSYSLEHNSIEAFFDSVERGYKADLQELQSKEATVTYEILTGKQALQTLQYSRICSISNISFIYAKLSEIAAVEVKIDELIANSFRDEVENEGPKG